jgi:hypothetical protein
LIYTDASGSGGRGIIKLAFEIDIDWVKDKTPRLKDVDVKRLCGLAPEEPQVIGKRPEREDRQEDEPSKEEKLRALKERFQKRQKT